MAMSLGERAEFDALKKEVAELREELRRLAERKKPGPKPKNAESDADD